MGTKTGRPPLLAASPAIRTGERSSPKSLLMRALAANVVAIHAGVRTRMIRTRSPVRSARHIDSGSRRGPWWREWAPHEGCPLYLRAIREGDEAAFRAQPIHDGGDPLAPLFRLGSTAGASARSSIESMTRSE